MAYGLEGIGRQEHSARRQVEQTLCLRSCAQAPCLTLTAQSLTYSKIEFRTLHLTFVNEAIRLVLNMLAEF
jgi:(2Fe-2S) ferredoxin